MNSTSIKRGDTSPAFTATLRDGDGNAVDILGATVKLLMRNKRTREVKVNAGATVVDGTAGTISYQWQSGDTDTAGVYDLEVEVTFGDGAVRTFPSDGYHELTVYGDVA